MNWQDEGWSPKPVRVPRPLNYCKCGQIHGTDSVQAVDRFRPEGPRGYRAVTVPGAELRATRSEAQADVCTWWPTLNASRSAA
jgi:hypothetical protein